MFYISLIIDGELLLNMIIKFYVFLYLMLNGDWIWYWNSI